MRSFNNVIDFVDVDFYGDNPEELFDGYVELSLYTPDIEYTEEVASKL